jgi:3-oxoacyl-[acyl-carrier-protein] synthase-3
MIGIHETAVFITGIRLSLSRLLQRDDLPEEQLHYFSRTGIQSVYDASGYSAYELARGASQRLLQRAGMTAAGLGLIIYVHNCPQPWRTPSHAAKLQLDLRASNALFYSVPGSGCTDMIGAIQQGREFLESDKMGRPVLICCGSKLCGDKRLDYPVTIRGDGGVALLLAHTDRNRIEDIRRESLEMHHLLQDNGLARGDIKFCLPQNLSMPMYFDEEKNWQLPVPNVCRENLAEVGHLGQVDAIFNYTRAVEKGILQKDDRVLLTTAGAGMLLKI